MTTHAKPCSAIEALARMQALTTWPLPYMLGTGGYDPKRPDDPCTTRADGKRGCDCAGAAQSHAYKIVRHDPGFASGRVPIEYRDQSDVDDDHNTNSAIEDALTKQEVYEFVLEQPVLPGDLIMYATLVIKTSDGEVHRIIGHVLMIKTVPPGWTPADGYHKLRLLQCCGPDGRTPLVIETDGSSIDKHNRDWPKSAHRARIVRVKGSQA